jgi:tRNA G18 (ribose-2'-O)-methylase SpoU
MTSRSLIHIDTLGDERIAAYTRMKERDLAREGGRFIAEGELVVRRLLASSFRAQSVLLASRRVDEMARLVPGDIPIYVAEGDLVNRIVGFKFHSGVMAVGLRGGRCRLCDVAGSWRRGRLTIVVCPEVANTENLGAMIRISSAFGADAMILGPQCCDPFYRQSIRVSMGAVFSLPMVQSEDLLGDLGVLRHQHGVELMASVLADDAEPLSGCRRPERLALLFGNEAEGLRPEHIGLCDRRVTIPMHPGTDSLNVSTSAGIFLHHFTQGQGAAGAESAFDAG